MSLIRWSDANRFPFLPHLLPNFFTADVSDFMGTWEGTVPAVNILETKDEYSIEVAAPGMSKQDFCLKLENGVLIVAGKKKASDNGEAVYHLQEFHYSTFQRSFHLPIIINTDKITAEYINGILLINLPKKDEIKKMQEVRDISIS